MEILNLPIRASFDLQEIRYRCMNESCGVSNMRSSKPLQTESFYNINCFSYLLWN